MDYVKVKDIDSFTVTKFVSGQENPWGKTEYKLEVEGGTGIQLSPFEMSQMVGNEVKQGRYSQEEGRFTVDILGRAYTVKHVPKQGTGDDGNAFDYVMNYINEDMNAQQSSAPAEPEAAPAA